MCVYGRIYTCTSSYINCTCVAGFAAEHAHPIESAFSVSIPTIFPVRSVRLAREPVVPLPVPAPRTSLRRPLRLLDLHPLRHSQRVLVHTLMRRSTTTSTTSATLDATPGMACGTYSWEQTPSGLRCNASWMLSARILPRPRRPTEPYPG